MQVKKTPHEKNDTYKYRYFFVFFVIAIFTLALLFQFGSLMISGEVPERFKPKSPTYRGAIKDRYGSLLALQTKLYNFWANKNLVTEPERSAEILSPIIGLSEAEIMEKFEKANSHFLYIKKKITESEKSKIAEALREFQLKGFMFEEILNRTYPESTLASTLIGFFGDDGYGLAGMEYSAQNILSPPETTEGYTGSGYDVYLTIDNTIQYMMKEASMQALEEWQAEGVIFLAADAKTGEILGYVSEPSPDLAHFTESTAAQLIDRPANYTYEPGSVFKIFTVASFLDLGIVNADTKFLCNGSYQFSNSALSPITCLTPHGTVNPEGVIQHSCNVGLAQMAANCQNEALYNKLKSFGFGSKTEVELPGESAGLFAPPKNWSARTKPTIAMGQEIGVTALQLVEAATSFANDGKRLRLSVISKITDQNGKILYLYKPQTVNDPISAETARQVLSYMKAENGIGWRASVGDVPIAVKTGTAQMSEKAQRGYSKKDFIASTIALFPADKPQIILYMAVIKPRGKIYGSLVVAPIIKQVASDIIDRYGLKRDGAINIQHSGFISTVQGEKIILGDTMPDLKGKSKKELQSLFDSELNPQRYKILIEGEGYVYEQSPDAGTELGAGTVIHLKLK